MDQASPARTRIAIIAVDGRRRLWHRGGAVHSLPSELGPTWVANFKPALFQVLEDGSLVPRGSAGGIDIASVELAADG